MGSFKCFVRMVKYVNWTILIRDGKRKRMTEREEEEEVERERERILYWNEISSSTFFGLLTKALYKYQMTSANPIITLFCSKIKLLLSEFSSHNVYSSFKETLGYFQDWRQNIPGLNCQANRPVSLSPVEMGVAWSRSGPGNYFSLVHRQLSCRILVCGQCLNNH